MSLALPRPSPGWRLWGGFAAMGLGMFMAVLDVQIVATSLPTIQQALGVAPDAISWIQTAYLMAEVVSIPLTGVLTRALTLRGLVVVALTGFTLASAGCAASPDLTALLICRVIQGFAGGVLIPAVFSAVFLLFTEREQPLATTLAGVLAVLAPTVGPIAGGTITATSSWHWLFLINLAPGLAAGGTAALLLPRDTASLSTLRRIDIVALLCLALSLAMLVFALKEAPGHGWLSPSVLAGFAITLLSGALFVHRTCHAPSPIVALTHFRTRNFALACLLSFVFGAGLFGSVYLMPVFLGYIRGHGPLEIGRIMLVTGVAQLVAAPLAAALETKVDARLLTLAGFLAFAVGLGLSTNQTIDTDYDAMLWPQALRGFGIMFCLVPATRLAFGQLPDAAIPDASGLFNLMRNLGGAIGLALIDTVLYGRAPEIGRMLMDRLRAGDPAAAHAVGIPEAFVTPSAAANLDPEMLTYVKGLVQKAALARASNEAWVMLTIATLCVATAIAFMTKDRDA